MKKLMPLIALMFIAVLVGCSQNTQGNDNENTAASTANSDDDFPSKPIELIVPFPAGGGVDVNDRILEKTVSEYLPNEQTVVVKNQEGGSGTVGMTNLSNSEPDGYTIGLSPVGSIAIQPALG